MIRFSRKNGITLALAFLGAWLGGKYLLPLAMPFLLGVGLALMAEPAVKFLAKKLPRGAAAGIGVTGTLLLLTSGVFLAGALVVKELGLLASALPDLSQTARTGLRSMEDFLLDLAEETPAGVRPLLEKTVTGAFRDSSAVVERVTARLPGMASKVLSWLPGSALTLGTGILSAFMVSARMPRLKRWLRRGPMEKILPVAKRIKIALGGWLKAQLKLAGLCFGVVCGGFLLLGIPYAPIWAALTALVDAIPVLGTGTVLIPWSLVCLLQGQRVRALGLVAVYVIALISRSALEPRLVGKQLGLDPLITLAALYTGFRLWGIPGMILSPMLCVAVTEATRE
jgi:sporulation integral membrane protein YtvI